MQTVLNQKPSCLLKGNLAFLLGEAVWISVRYLKLCDFFDTGKVSQPTDGLSKYYNVTQPINSIDNHVFGLDNHLNTK